MGVRVMNMPCTSLEDMLEVTCKILDPAAAETIPLPSILIYCNVLDHIGLRGTLRYFEDGHSRYTEGFMTNEVTAHVTSMRNVVRTLQRKTSTAELMVVSPLDTSICQSHCNNTNIW